ncbi:hypothetical protein NEIFLAOT_01900, partial [Neisseria flavescens NRL30031/H210]
LIVLYEFILNILVSSIAGLFLFNKLFRRPFEDKKAVGLYGCFSLNG